MVVKYVPIRFYTGTIPQKFYQYTVIDEASRERFLLPYLAFSSYSSVDFLQQAIRYFGYAPQIVQTDNGSEFTHIQPTPLIHPFDKTCTRLGITHQRIYPRTPRHNGRIERSHRNDKERFYAFLQFYSFQDLHKQMRCYLRRSNHIPVQMLGWKPSQDRTGTVDALVFSIALEVFLLRLSGLTSYRKCIEKQRQKKELLL